jgi:hypothetical protein
MPGRTSTNPDLPRGDLRLLHDLAVLQVALDADRPPARERLERTLGADFARALCSSLAETAAKAA